MHRFTQITLLTLLSLTLLSTPLWSQPATPTPATPWWQVTADQVPYVLLLLIALVAFFLGGLLRPLLELAGNALTRWFQGWGKHGRFRQAYLTHVVGQHRFLTLIWTASAAGRWEYRRKAVDLEELYTPLSLETGRPAGEDDWRISERRRPLPRLQTWLQTLWQRLRPPHQPTAGDLGAVLQANPRLVVRGDPGSGKTTILRYLALTCARSLRNDHSDGDQRTMARKRLGWRRPRFPILAPLNLLADVTTWPADRRLLDEIIDTLPPHLRGMYPKDFFEQQLQRGHCLLLLDGFDELGSRAARGRMAQLIADLANTYTHPHNRFVVSTRIVGYEAQLDGFGFTVRTVQPLNDQALDDLVHKRYRAIAVGEGVGSSPQRQIDLANTFAAQANRLLADLHRNRSLRALTTNPLLLSLIVLVHLTKVKLPEQRHLLYRDCVEILTERWQARKREEAGLPATPQPDDLTLEQKIVLLQDIALAMQRVRREDASQAVISRDRVEAIIAARLPNFIAAHLPSDATAQIQECQRRANALLDDIREGSGILAEKGLDDAGEPVVGFSHLTFQEYLAADALRERPAELPILQDNLFNPTWRETLLLYVGMVDAGPLIQATLDDPRQLPLTRYLLAGRCLAEKLNIDPQVGRQVLGGLRAYWQPPGANELQTIHDLFARLGGEQPYDWLIDNLAAYLTEGERQVWAAPPAAHPPGHFYPQLQQLLLRIMHQAQEISIRYRCGCTLSAIGDPRTLDELVTIPAGEFFMGSESGASREQPLHKVYLNAYAIGKYPVTNAQYQRFVAATGRPPPRFWRDGKFAPWQATQPVVCVTWHDAQAYCAWLTASTGRPYRLPTEAEWEKAARGDADQREYPWGDQFDPQRVNTAIDRGDWTTTPVGLYPEGASPYGLFDMGGNVLEWTNSQYRPYPYDPNDGREGSEGDATRTLRGGSFYGYDGYVRCAARLINSPVDRFDSIGFRVVAPGF
jgi:formylglycine-generating enzyme required for sulfatase activity